MKNIRVIALVLAMMLPGALAGQGMEDQAKTRYQEIMKELELKKSSMPMEGLIDLGERLLLEFVEKYPGTQAGGSAHLTLGQIYGSINRPDAAIKHLEKYFEGTRTRDAAEMDMARYTLANVYIQEGDFDKGEKQLRAIVERGAAADKRLMDMAGATLDRLGTLKRLSIGGQAIEFSATATDGKPLRLSDYRGKVVLIDFWATWCSPCRAEMPNVKKVYDGYHAKGFDIVGISMDNSREQFDTYISQNGIAWRQIFDGKGWKAEIGQQYAVLSIPATFLVDRGGVIRFKNLRGDELEKAVAELVAEKR